MSLLSRLFSDKCTALIDPATGEALQGEALEKARSNPGAPRCGHPVAKKARWCSKCGSGAPDGWAKCPGCGNWVGNESRFCWNCKTPLYPDSRLDLAGGVWQKPEGVFAERFEAGDVKPLTEKGLQIQTGTSAILLDGGKMAGILHAGRHTPESLAHKINWFGNPPPRSMILVESGDVVLPLRVDGLRSSEEIPLEFYGEVTLRLKEKDAEEFVANLLKDTRQLTYEGLAGRIGAEIRYAVTNFCNGATIEDLVKDPERRTRLEDELAATLKTKLERIGIELVRIGAADFIGKEYEQLRQKAGEIDVQRRQYEFTQKLRELAAGDRMQEFKTQHDLDEYVHQLAQEKAVGAERRDQELAVLRLLHRQEIDKKAADFAMVQELAKLSHTLGLRKREDEYRRESELVENQNRANITKMWLEVKKEKQKLDREHMEGLAEIYNSMDPKAMMAMIDDPAKRADLLKMMAQTNMQSASADVILAAAAAQNPELARVLIERERGKREDRDKDMEERKKQLDQMAERLQQMYNTGMQAMSESARHPGATTQIVK
jgi:hypothetical protein